MLFHPRNYPALSLTSDGCQLQGLSLSRQRGRLVVSCARQENVPEGTVLPGFAVANIHDMATFSTAVKRLLQTIAGKENRIALCLPDQVAQTHLLDLETKGMNPQRVERLVRWQLRDSLPEAPGTYSLAIRAVSPLDGDTTRYLVAVIKSMVLRQYQQVIHQAGYDVVLCDLHSLALRNHLLCQGGTILNAHLLVTLVDQQLGFVVHDGRKPRYCRLRHISEGERQLCQEIRRSFLAAQQVYAELKTLPVYHFCNAHNEQCLVSVLTALSGGSSHLITGKLAKVEGVAAYCAAERIACGWG